MITLSTLCYLEHDGCYLMLHRVTKQNDLNGGKWIGVGGRFEAGESPEDCLQREVREETGWSLRSWRFRGIVTFLYGDVTEYMHLFTSDDFITEQGRAARDSGGCAIPVPACDEGVLEWVPVKQVPNLELWEGDRIFLRLLRTWDAFFSLKLVYDTDGNLIDAVLNGNKIVLQG